MLEQNMIGLLKKMNRFSVFSAAMLIGQPFTIGSQIVAVKH